MILNSIKTTVCPRCKGEGVEFKEKYGCETCRKDLGTAEENKYLLVRVVNEFDSGAVASEDYHFCSWKCLIAKLPEFKCNYYINLPFLSFDTDEDGLRACDFFDAIKGFGEKKNV